MYKTQSQPVFMFSSARKNPAFWVLNDESPAVESGQNLLSRYIKDACGIFKSEVDILLGTDRLFAEADAERLTIMLKLLIDARKTWEEEEASAKA